LKEQKTKLFIPSIPGNRCKTQSFPSRLAGLCFLMQRVLSIKGAVFVQLKLALHILAVLLRCIILALTLAALKRDDFNN
jgi:hypothetical protein